MTEKLEMDADLVEAFEYLDELRESGVTNMFGARPYVEAHTAYDGQEAGVVLGAWMRTFDGESSAYDRAVKAATI